MDAKLEVGFDIVVNWLTKITEIGLFHALNSFDFNEFTDRIFGVQNWETQLMNIYIGPYVECMTQDIEVDAVMRTCTRTTCLLHKEEVHDKNKNFCPQCGASVDQVTHKIKKKNVKAQYLVKEIDHDLSNISEDTFFSNRSSDEGIDTWIANLNFCERNCWIDESFVTEITKDIIEEEVYLFYIKFEKALAIFNEKYGKGNVAVKWGLVHYYS